MANQSLMPTELFHALGDETRLLVVRQLCRGSATVSQLAQPHAMALPTFIQHLRVLEQTQWIVTSKRGRVRTCHINPKALEVAGGWLETQRRMWTKRLDQLDRYLVRTKMEVEK